MRRLLLVLLVLLAAPSVAAAQPGVRVLLVPGGSLPARMRAPVTGLFASRAVLVSTSEYVRAADERGLRPSAPRAIRIVGTLQGADVIALATYRRRRRSQILRVRFFHGGTGELVTSGTYRLRGRRMRPAAQHALLRDLAAAAGGRAAPSPAPRHPVEAPEVEQPPEVERVREVWEEPEQAPPELDEPEPDLDDSEPEDPGAASGESAPRAGFGIAGGLGVGQRANVIPMEGAEAILSSTAFPTMQLEARGSIQPDGSNAFRLELSARYTGSLGLQVEDRMSDGNTRTSDMRMHHFLLGLNALIPLASGTPATLLLVGFGGSFNVLESDLDVSIPDYALGGVLARAGFVFPIGDSPITVALVPEIGHAVSLSDELSERGGVSDGVSVGAEGTVRAQLIDELAISIVYRESHAFLSSEHGGEMSDTVRYGTLRLEYTQR